MSFQSISAILDEHKHDMPDGVYLSLYNSLKELHEAAKEAAAASRFLSRLACREIAAAATAAAEARLACREIAAIATAAAAGEGSEGQFTTTHGDSTT